MISLIIFTFENQMPHMCHCSSPKSINLINFDSMLDCNIENIFVQIPPMVMVDPWKHVVARLKVQSSSESLHPVAVFCETHAGLALVAEPEGVHVLLFVLHQVVSQVAYLRAQHEQPREDAKGRHAPPGRLKCVHCQEWHHDRHEQIAYHLHLLIKAILVVVKKVNSNNFVLRVLL